MEKRRVVVTGLGTVNPLGNTVAESWAAAKAGQCGIAPITQFDTAGFKCKLAAEVKGFDPEAIVDKKELRKMARFTLLALAAANEAIQDSGLDTEANAKTTGVILSSGIGGLPTIEEQHTRGEEKGMEKVSPYFVPMSIANMAAAQVAIRFGLKGMCTCPVTACAGGTNAVGDAFHRIRDGYEDAMVCGGAESCISPLGIGGFTSMKALSTATDPDAASLPFDARRGGFVMGEGSGVLVLEELEHAKARGAHIYAEVVGYGANCDAYHFTAPAPGGAGRQIRPGHTGWTAPRRSSPAAPPVSARENAFYFSSPHGGAAPPAGCRGRMPSYPLSRSSSYHTRVRYRPPGGAVGPANVRLPESRITGISSGASLPSAA